MFDGVCVLVAIYSNISRVYYNSMLSLNYQVACIEIDRLAFPNTSYYVIVFAVLS